MYKKKSDVYSQHVSSVLEFIYRKKKTARIEIANATGPDPCADDRDHRNLKAVI